MVLSNLYAVRRKIVSVTFEALLLLKVNSTGRFSNSYSGSADGVAQLFMV